ncbi:tetratricopeptide repeat protein [candidate division KSB1 bacterium]|nr:tetratricopeptide repeat protein [candidate division KSB1 bacterium]
MNVFKNRGALLIVLLSLLLVGCVTAKSDGDKLPLTTSSDAALENFKQGRDIFEKLRFREARQYFKNAVNADPNFAMAHLYLAMTQPTAKKFFASLDKATSLVDQVSEGERLWILGFEAGSNGKPARQLDYYQKLVELYPNDERTHNLLAGSYFGQQQYHKAIAEYEKAIDINPEFSQPYNQLGYAYRFLGKYDKSEKTFKKYIKVIPDDPNPYDSYAELLLKIGKYDESIKNYRKALQIKSDFVPSHIGIATNYNLKGEHEKAREQLKTYYNLAEDEGQRRAALFATTVSYVDEGNVEKALATLKKQYAIAEEINDPAAMAGDLGTMGNILLEFGKPDKALKKFNASVEIMRESDLGPDQKELAEQGYRFNLTQVALKKGDLSAAKKHAEEYRKHAESRNNRFQIWAAHQLTGRIALAEEDFSRAINELEKSNLQNPYNIYRLAVAYEGKGDKVKADELFEKARNFNALNSLAYSFMRNKDKKMTSGTY